MCERLAADGHSVTVLTTDAWDLEHFWSKGKRRIEREHEVINGVTVRRFPVARTVDVPLFFPVLRRLMAEIGRVPKTERLLRRLSAWTPRLPAMERYLATTDEQFDLVSTANITFDFAIQPGEAYARQKGIPHVCTPFVHVGEPGNTRVVRSYTMRHQLDILRRCDRVIVQTEIERRALVERGILDERIRCVGAGVDPEALKGGDGERFRREHRLGKLPVVLFIGTAAHGKGAVHLLEAMRTLWREGREVALVFVCSSVMSHFEGVFSALSESEKSRCRLIRGASHQVKLDALAAAEVFAMPSRTDSFGIVYLEAWCYDVPVIGARAGGVPDVIDDEENGFLVPFGDVPALARQLCRLIDDPSLAARLGASGHQKVLRRLTWEHKFGLFRQAIETLANSV
jgi:glycosyltransferase involved in cell wall biosynthesis